MHSQRCPGFESASASRRGRRLPGALSLWALSVCILVAALLAGAATPPPAQAASTGSATGGITGTVTVSGGAAAFASVWLYMETSDGWKFDQSATTNALGFYSFAGLEAASYRVGFQDSSGDLGSATSVAVTAGATTPNINAALLSPGHITGTVTNATPAGVENIDVTAYRHNGAGGWTYVNDVTTASDGSYDLGGLDTGRYRVHLTDSTGD